MGLESYQLGRQGEEIAAKYLTSLDYKIIERNFHSQQGEIDIIAYDKETLVFAEVKNYSLRSYGSAFGAVRKSKRESIIHAARTYLLRKNIRNVNCRFDVLAINTERSGKRSFILQKNAFLVN